MSNSFYAKPVNNHLVDRRHAYKTHVTKKHGEHQLQCSIPGSLAMAVIKCTCNQLSCNILVKCGTFYEEK